MGSTDYIFSVAFSPDGRTLATGSNDGSVRLYSTAPGSSDLPTSTLTSYGSAVLAVAYRPDGRQLSGAGRGDHIAQWTTTPGAYARTLCPIVGDRITRAEWAQYVRGAKYNPPCR